MTETSTQKNYLPIIIGTLLTLAVLIGGFIFIQKSLSGDSSFQASANLVRPTNPVVGKKDSKITFVYLYDYQCPACQSNADNMTTLKSSYADKIAFVYKPYIVHPGSGDRMAYAAMAADKQGKFSEFNEKLIKLTPTAPNGLSVSELENVAKEVGMDSTKFVKDYNSKEIEDQIKLDQKDIANTIMPVSEFVENKGTTKIGSTPTVALLKDGKITSSWWSGVLPLEDSAGKTGVKSRINAILEQK